MNHLRVFDYLENKEVETTFEKFTGLKIGDRVAHVNAGKFGGATKDGCRYITKGFGTIIGFADQGEHHWGGHCVTVTVRWDDGEEYSMVHHLAKKL